MYHKIANDILIKRQGQYCHALEVNDIFELQAIIDALYDEFILEYTIDDILEFFNSIELYCLNDKNEEAVYNFNIEKYISDNY